MRRSLDHERFRRASWCRDCGLHRKKSMYLSGKREMSQMDHRQRIQILSLHVGVYVLGYEK